MIPARGVSPRVGQVAVDNGGRIIRGGGHLAEKDLAKKLIRAGGLIGGHHVQQFVAHDPVDAFVGGTGLVDVLEGFDTQRQVVVGNTGGAGVAEVVHVLEDHRHVFVRRVVEHAPVEVQGIFEAAGDMGDDVVVVLGQVDQAHVFGAHLPEFESGVVIVLVGRLGSGQRTEKQQGRHQGPCRQQSYARDRPDCHTRPPDARFPAAMWDCRNKWSGCRDLAAAPLGSLLPPNLWVPISPNPLGTRALTDGR